jgi:hypothetical protein
MRGTSRMTSAKWPSSQLHFDRWLEADTAAMEASMSLVASIGAFYKGAGPEPTLADRARVSGLREDAQRLYRRAMFELEELGAQIRGQFSD